MMYVMFLTDGGLETDLIEKGAHLPEFAAFTLLDREPGRGLLRAYYREYIAVARAAEVGFVLEAPTWRANPDWAARLGYGAHELAAFNRLAVELMAQLRVEAALDTPVVVSGCVGPRADDYEPGSAMTADQARDYHRAQIETLAGAAADLVTGTTIGAVTEATGIAQAASDAGIPAVISFTIGEDGALPDGTSLAAAVTAVDDATRSYPDYYMVNCAHPANIAHALDPEQPWVRRVSGLRANSSAGPEPDSGEPRDDQPDTDEPVEFGRLYRQLLDSHPHMSVLGGCCGTDIRHIRAIAAACL